MSNRSIERQVYTVLKVSTNLRMKMIPVGYMLKEVVPCPAWIEVESVVDIYSVSKCISHDFADYIKFWKHNGYWFFNDSRELVDLARSEGKEVAGMTLFYYEFYELEYNEQSDEWSVFSPDSSFPTAVQEPHDKRLMGYDVATFSQQNTPECSPLSCNMLATELPVNQHCLFETFEEAKSALESGRFKNSEPGPFRIVAVYTFDSFN